MQSATFTNKKCSTSAYVEALGLVITLAREREESPCLRDSYKYIYIYIYICVCVCVCV